MSIISVKGLTKIFGPDPERALSLLKRGASKQEIFEQTKLSVGVNHVSFDIEEGEIFVIMGLSGSGKSTLVRLFNRLIEPTTGQVKFRGRDIVTMNATELREVRRNSMAMVFQNFALFPNRSLVENVEYGLQLKGVDKKTSRKKARETLSLVGLKDLDGQYPNQLSGGMQQRVGLARALANDPEILLMDEAFSALDPLIRKDMQDELLDVQQAMKKTIIFITHDLDEALRLGDRIALMRNGSIVQIGSPEEILMHPANPFVARFVEDVDLSKVLTAAHVMRRPETINPDRGPRVALQLMRDNGVSNLFLVNKARKMLGVISAEDASRAIKENLSLIEVATEEVPIFKPDQYLNELFEIVSQSRIPAAVVDANDRLVGIIVRGAVLAALSGNMENAILGSEIDD